MYRGNQTPHFSFNNIFPKFLTLHCVHHSSVVTIRTNWRAQLCHSHNFATHQLHYCTVFKQHSSVQNFSSNSRRSKTAFILCWKSVLLPTNSHDGAKCKFG